jgi:hypothetical protein
MAGAGRHAAGGSTLRSCHANLGSLAAECLAIDCSARQHAAIRRVPDDADPAHHATDTTRHAAIAGRCVQPIGHHHERRFVHRDDIERRRPTRSAVRSSVHSYHCGAAGAIGQPEPGRRRDGAAASSCREPRRQCGARGSARWHAAALPAVRNPATSVKPLPAQGSRVRCFHALAGWATLLVCFDRLHWKRASAKPTSIRLVRDGKPGTGHRQCVFLRWDTGGGRGLWWHACLRLAQRAP